MKFSACMHMCGSAKLTVHAILICAHDHSVAIMKELRLIMIMDVHVVMVFR